MPHCDNCLMFYPQAMPAGCPFCDKNGFHKLPYCQFCGVQPKGVVEADPATGQPLRPNCPNCLKGPLIPSTAELKRRLKLNPAVEPFIPLPTEVATVDEDGEATTLHVDGEVLADIKLRRTHGPVELWIQSPKIETYFREIARHFGPARPGVEAGAPVACPASSGPYAGLRYYPVPTAAASFYDPTGNVSYTMRGYGADLSLPGSCLTNGRGGSVDLSFLLTAGLADGVTFKYATVVDSQTIRTCLKAVKDGVVSIYAYLMRPIEHHVLVAARTVTIGDKAAGAKAGPAAVKPVRY